ncbi:exported hypothetical protein [Pseudomonas chlororaphis]
MLALLAKALSSFQFLAATPATQLQLFFRLEHRPMMTGN